MFNLSVTELRTYATNFHSLLKKNAWQVIGCLVLAIFVARPYLHQGFPYTHDNENHLARFANYKIALKEGQFPPRWAPNLANHYGYPVFNYNYPLANILSVPGSLLKLNYEVIFKLLVVGSLWFGFLGAWVWLSQLKFKTTAKWVSVVSFAVAPYVLNLLVVRGNIGELLAMMLLPWLLAGVEWWRQTPRLKVVPVVLFCIAQMAFGLSHNISAVLGLVLLIVYAIWRLWKQWPKLGRYGVVLIWTLLSIAWFWLPALSEKSLVILDSATVNQDVTAHFATVAQLLSSPLTFGYSYIGQIDTLSFAVGLSSLLALILVSYLLVRVVVRSISGRTQLNTVGWLLLFLVLSGWSILFLETSVSGFIYRLLPPLNFLQFPWRLSLFWQVLLLPVTAFAWTQFGKWWRVFLVGVILWQLGVALRTVPVDYFHKTNVDYEAFSQTTSTSNENRPQNYTYLPTGDWQPTPLVATGAANIQVTRWSGSKHQYALNVTQPSIIIEPTANFAGWQTVTNGQKVAYYDSAEVGGRIAYKIEPGAYQVTTIFTQQTPARIWGNGLSLFAVFTLLGWSVYTYVKRRGAQV